MPYGYSRGQTLRNLATCTLVKGSLRISPNPRSQRRKVDESGGETELGTDTRAFFTNVPVDAEVRMSLQLS